MLGYLAPSRLFTIATKSALVLKTKCIGGQHVFVLFVLCLQLLIPTSFAGKKTTKADDTLKKPCENCRELVQNFIDEFKLTDRGLYEGGDTDWEVKNLKDYRKSEVRFIEITEKIYKSKVTHVTRLLEDVEESLEDFWRDHWQHVGDSNELDSFLCVSLKKVCCPYGFFGADCSPCKSGENDSSNCSDHGTCNGNGTRSGTGQCKCDDGYHGSFCEDCKKGYKRDDQSKLCVDIDECASSNKNPCEDGKYCRNQPGYYSCKACHEACANLTCNGPEPENCTGGACAEGYDKMIGADAISIIGCAKLDDDDEGENVDDINSGENANITSDGVNDERETKENGTNSTDGESRNEANENENSSTEKSKDENVPENDSTDESTDENEEIGSSEEESGGKVAASLKTVESLPSVADLGLEENLVDGSSKTEKNIEL